MKPDFFLPDPGRKLLPGTGNSAKVSWRVSHQPAGQPVTSLPVGLNYFPLLFNVLLASRPLFFLLIKNASTFNVNFKAFQGSFMDSSLLSGV